MTVQSLINYIDDLFSDASVPVATTRESLERIAGHIEMLLDTLPQEDD